MNAIEKFKELINRAVESFNKLNDSVSDVSKSSFVISDEYIEGVIKDFESSDFQDDIIQYTNQFIGYIWCIKEIVEQMNKYPDTVFGDLFYFKYEKCVKEINILIDDQGILKYDKIHKKYFWIIHPLYSLIDAVSDICYHIKKDVKKHSYKPKQEDYGDGCCYHPESFMSD